MSVFRGGSHSSPLIICKKNTLFLKQRFLGEPIFIHILKCGGTSIEEALGIPKTHDTALTRCRRVGADNWDRAFTFSVVRHPYSKVISHYHYRRKHDETGVRSDGIEINDWIRQSYGAKNPKYYDRPIWFAPCMTWLSDEDGNLMVDYVAKLETIDVDWPIIADRIGTTADLSRRNVSSVDAGNWNILDARSKSIIDAHFRTDFEIFNYTAS